MQHDDFKENHEGLAAREFLPRYNELHSTDFELIEKEPNSEPDFHSRDSKTGEALNFDVTLGTTRFWIDQWKKLLAKDRSERPRPQLSPEEEFRTCVENVCKKLSKRYGPNCALVVYHFSPCLYAADFLDDLRRSVDFSTSRFDKGIWLLSTAEFYRLDEIPAPIDKKKTEPIISRRL